MPNPFDLGEILEEAGRLDQPAAPPPDASLPPNDDKATVGDSPEHAQTITTETGEQSAAPAQTGEEPPQPEAVVEDDPKTTTNLARVRTWGEGLETDIRERYKPVVDEVETLGGLDLVKSVAAPLLANEVNGDAVLDTITAERGQDAYESVAWAVINRHNDWLIARALERPDTIKDPEVRQRVLSLLNARPGDTDDDPPRRTGYEESDADPPAGDEDLTTLPPSVQARLKRLDVLEAQMADLNKYRETEQQRREREDRERVEERTADLNGRVFGPMKTLIAPVRFSTEVDPQKAESENAMIRADIEARVVRELENNQEARALYREIHGAHVVEYQQAMLAGDKLRANKAAKGVVEKIRELKEKVDETTKRHIKHFEKVYGAQSQVDQQTLAKAGERKVVTGSSGVAAPIEPPQKKTSNIWDTGEMIAEANARSG